MRALGIIAACIAALIAGAVVWYKLAFPDYTHRYRLTIAIVIDGQTHTSSSIVEVVYVGQPYVPGAGSFIPHVRGQAVFVDLGERGAMIGALHPGTIQNGSSSATYLAMRAYGVTGGYESYRVIGQQKGRRELAPDNMPLLIWFRNVADPTTARVTRREEIPDLFGSTARLVTAEVEITSDPIVIDIDKKLPWYSELAARQKKHGAITRPNEFQPIHNMFIGEGS